MQVYHEFRYKKYKNERMSYVYSWKIYKHETYQIHQIIAIEASRHWRRWKFKTRVSQVFPTHHDVEVLHFCQQKVGNGAPLLSIVPKSWSKSLDAHLSQKSLRSGRGGHWVHVRDAEASFPHYSIEREGFKKEIQWLCERR